MSDVWDDANLPSRKASRINEDRMATYGHPYNNHRIIAALWSAYLDHPLEVEDVSAMMILLKVAREKVGEFDIDFEDNVDDVAGFANTLYVVKEMRRGRDNTPAAAEPPAEGEGRVGSAQLPGGRHAGKPARRSGRAR